MPDNVSLEMMQMLSKAGNNDPAIALPAMRFIAQALVTPLREGLLAGDVVTDIFAPISLTPGQPSEFPLDFLPPGAQKDYIAYTIPKHGRIPESHIEGDYVMVPVYDIANSIDWLLKYSEQARWDVVKRAMAVFEAGFVKKTNDDGWHTLLYAGLDRNIVLYDSDAGSGQFTKRLVGLMKTVMARQGGGNTSTPNKAKLTDIFLSPENIEDVRNWGVDIIDEVSRREIFLADDSIMTRLFGVSLRPLYELGEGQEYQLFYQNSLGGLLQSNDVELIVGLDLQKNDAFISPSYKTGVEVFEDPNMHRQQRHGIYGWKNQGFAVLDNRRIILASC